MYCFTGEISEKLMFHIEYQWKMSYTGLQQMVAVEVKRGRRKRMKIIFGKSMKLQTYTVVMKVACCWIISLWCLYLVCELFKNWYCATANNCGWSSSVLLRYTIVSETRYAPSATPAAVCCYLQMPTLLLCSEFLPNHWCTVRWELQWKAFIMRITGQVRSLFQLKCTSFVYGFCRWLVTMASWAKPQPLWLYE